MSELPNWLLTNLTQHTLCDHKGTEINSQRLDRAIGLTWRNASVDHLLSIAAGYEKNQIMHLARLFMDAALLKEAAINHGINLEN